jgi:hypothetical protein
MWLKHIFHERTRPQPARSARRPQLEWLGSYFSFPLGIHARAPPEFPVTRTKIPHGFLRLFASPRPCLPHAPRLQASSSREFVHMQAGQCGSQMDYNFWEVECGENGIGGDGKTTV